MSTLNAYREKFRWLSKKEIVQERRDLFRIINGDAFKAWPQEMARIFWSKPINDTNTFKLMLFCLGNGCSPNLITEWILLSQTGWAPDKAEKRARQMDFIFINMECKRDTWFYFDVDYDKWLYLNGLPKRQTRQR